MDYAAFLTAPTALELQEDCNVTQLLTAALGLTAESGEFTEVVKKIIFQGKPYNEDNVFHMKRELGDICWYLAQACMALDTTFDEVLEMNVDKLKHVILVASLMFINLKIVRRVMYVISNNQRPCLSSQSWFKGLFESEAEALLNTYENNPPPDRVFFYTGDDAEALDKDD